MALDLSIRVTDRETGTPTELFTQLSLTPRELSYLNMLIDTLQFGGEIIKLDID